MALKNLAGIVVGLVIMVVFLSAVLIPIVNDSEQSVRTTANNTGEIYSMGTGSTPDITLSNAGVVDDVPSPTYYNGEVLEAHNGAIITASNFDLRTQSDGQLFINDLVNNKQIQINVTTNGKLDLTVVGTTLNYKANSSSDYTTVELGDYYFYLDSKGKYGGYSTVNVTPGQPIYALFYPIYVGPSLGYWTPIGMVELTDGVVTDTILAPKLIVSNVWTDVTNPTYSITATLTDADYYEYGRTTLSYDEYAATPTAEYIAPIEYQYISYADDSMIQLLSVIPLMVAVGIVVGVIGAVLVKRE